MPKSERAAAHQRAFGLRVRELRTAANLSQEELADRAGLHRTYVGAVERGERNLALDAMWRLADALEVRPADLFTDNKAS